jgi:hypothetical protein
MSADFAVNCANSLRFPAALNCLTVCRKFSRVDADEDEDEDDEDIAKS